MGDLADEGKIRGFGLGLERLGGAAEWLETGVLSGIQVPFGVLDPEARDLIIPQADSLGVSVIARAVFAGGLIPRVRQGVAGQLRPDQEDRLVEVSQLAACSGVDVLQVATWFVTVNVGVSTVLVGTSSVQHLRDAVRYIGTPPPDDMIATLLALAREHPVRNVESQ